MWVKCVGEVCLWCKYVNTCTLINYVIIYVDIVLFMDGKV